MPPKTKKHTPVSWVTRALTDNGVPSSSRLNAFIVMIVLSVIAMMLTCKLVFGLGDTIIGNTLDGICLSLAALGGAQYIGGRIAGRSKTVDDEDEPNGYYRKSRRRSSRDED